MSDLENLLNELLDPETAVDVGGVELTLAEFLAIADALDTEPAEVTPPKRDTPQYRDAILAVSELDDLKTVVSALRQLHDDYGWRGPVDVMAEWVGQIERTEFYSPRYRDLTGTVDLTRIIVIDADEEQQLRMAADRQHKYRTSQGLAPHAAFQEALAQTEQGLSLTRRWHPHLRAALTAAHATGDRRAVVAELFRAPGRTDREELIKGAMVLGTAAYGVRHHQALASRFDEVANGRESVTDPSITPGWGEGASVSLSALRRKD